MLHSNSVKNHKIENWTYANASARTSATGFVSADVGKVAYQSDNGSYWRLTAITPTWVSLQLPGLPTGGTTGQVLEKASGSNYDATWVDLLSGGTGLSYTWLTATSDVNPGAGKLSGDDTPDASTYLRISKTDGDANTVDAVISSWQAYSGSMFMLIQDIADPTIFVVQLINGITDDTTHYDLQIGSNGPIASNGTFTNNEKVTVQFLPVSGNRPSVHVQPSDPTGTTDTTGKMMGLGGSWKITPMVAQRILVTVSGTIFNSSGVGDGAKVCICAGTGTAPTNGAAPAGTAYSKFVQYISSTTAGKVPFSISTIVNSLTPNTPYWFDLKLAAITAGTANITDIDCTAVEAP